MLSSLLLAAASALSVGAASLQQINGISPNPNNVAFYSYVPASLAQPPPLILALHYCTGTAQAYYSGTQYASLADQHGYIVIYPSSPRSGGCWDVNTNATLTHNGGSDSIAMAASVTYAIKTWGVDPNRVYVTGTSSGAMMTNVLLGAYPDVFKAGVAYSGVPYGCFAGASDWNSQCAQGQLIKTAQQWGDQVRSGYPGYTGPRPGMQVWHGTADTTLYPQNFYEEVKQWTNVFGYSQTPLSNVTNQPQSGYSNATYGPLFQAILAQGVGHTVPEHATNTLDFFGLSNLKPGQQTTTSVGGGTTTTTTSSPGGGTTTSPTTTSSTPPTTTSSANTATQTKYGQCGGIGWTGPTVCAAGSTCKYSNAYYSQCL